MWYVYACVGVYVFVNVCVVRVCVVSVCVCVYVWGVCLYMYGGLSARKCRCWWGQRRHSLDLNLQALVNWFIRVLGIKFLMNSKYF